MIRPALQADAPAVRGLLAALGYSGLGRAFDETFAALLADPTTRILVATSDESGDEITGSSASTLVGLVTLSVRPALRLARSIATIDELVVAASDRGSSIGAALIQAAREEARVLGAARLEVQTRRARESYVRGFYAKQGFTEIDSALFRLELLEHGPYTGRPAP